MKKKLIFILIICAIVCMSTSCARKINGATPHRRDRNCGCENLYPMYNLQCTMYQSLFTNHQSLMKKLLLLITAVLFLAACGGRKTSVVISGDIRNGGNAKMTLALITADGLEKIGIRQRQELPCGGYSVPRVVSSH